MKRRLLALSFLLLTLGALIWGKQVTESLLDQKLAPLLTEQLGIPVRLAPIRVHLLSLRASSDRLRMGENDNLAIDASKVKVTLAWKSLLRGEIRLHSAQAEDLMVNISRWPRSGSLWPKNYRYLDPWLPTVLDLDKGHYVNAKGGTYALQQARWRRTPGQAAQIEWREARAAGEFRLSLILASLPALLDVKTATLSAEVLGPGLKTGDLSLSAQLNPDKGGYKLSAEAILLGTPVSVQAHSATPYTFPQKSLISLDKLTPIEFYQRFNALQPAGKVASLEAFLAKTIPELTLPLHSAELRIGQLHIGDLYAKQNHATINTAASGVRIEGINSNGPAGILRGDVHLQQHGKGDWQFDAKAEITARSTDGGIANDLLDSEWHWREGKVDIEGQGRRWGELVDSLHGEIALLGSHRTGTVTPIDIKATLGHREDLFSLEDIQVKLGEALITGRIEFPGDVERKLVLDLKGEALDLRFLFSGKLEEPKAGIPLPDFLTQYQEIDLEWKLDLSHLQLPTLNLTTLSTNLVRKPDSGRVDATGGGPGHGRLALDLNWHGAPDRPSDVDLELTLQDVDLEHLYTGRTGVFKTHSSGKLSLQSHGSDVESIFRAMLGRAELQTRFRRDGNWERQSEPIEEFNFAGDSKLIIKDRRILGVRVDQLNITSLNQDLTGSVSIAAGQEPWLSAELTSSRLDVTALAQLLPKSSTAADERGLLVNLRRFGPSRISLVADELLIQDTSLSSVTLELDRQGDRININPFNFSMEKGGFRSRAHIIWQDEQTLLDAEGEVDQLILDSFFQQLALDSRVPLRGSFKLNSAGRTTAELISGASGFIDLEGTQAVTADNLSSRRQLELQLQRIPDGVIADIHKLQIGRSDLKGKVTYTHADKDFIDIAIDGGHLQLTRWEDAKAPPDTAGEKDTTLVSRAANASSSLLHSVLTAPNKLIDGEDDESDADSTEEADKDQVQAGIFSKDAFDLGYLRNNHLRVAGRLDQVNSRSFTATDIELDIDSEAGKLTARLESPSINQGSATAELVYDMQQLPATASLQATLVNIQREKDATDPSVTIVVDLNATGSSPAELAGALEGMVYSELGKGTIDYGGITFLTADVAQSMFRALIPAAEKKLPVLQCGITVGVFDQGIGHTPYGYAAQTRSANLLGNMEVNLIEEQIRVAFDSASRTGTGLSLGNMFSNSVRIEGPLNAPQIVPNTTSLLARGWVAFATAGLSMVGEGMLRRVLASEDPCGDIRTEIREVACKPGTRAIKSAIICPQNTEQVDSADAGKQ